MARNSFVQTHERIVSELRKIGTRDACTSVGMLARATKSDARTVKKHLEIAEIDDIGRFTDSEKKIFCIKESIGNLFKDEERLAEVQSRWAETFKDKSALEILHKKKV